MKRSSFARWLSGFGLAALLVAGAASAADVYVLISAGFYGAYSELAPAFERASGHRLITTRGPSMGDSPEAIPTRLTRGETADVVILDGGIVDELGRRGLVRADSKVELARSMIGMVVRAGAVKPDIGTVEAFRSTLLAAKSIAYSDSGSGTYLSNTLFARLGVADQVASKSRKVRGPPSGEAVATVVARGEAEIGFQQVSELIHVPGITYVGAIPAELQPGFSFAGALTTKVQQPEAATALLHFLASPDAAAAISKAGLTPLSATSLAQSLRSAEIDPQSLRRRLPAAWSQAEREFGFANWDQIFPARTIARGEKVRPLPEGTPLPTFSSGGKGATQLQRNIDDFKLAAIVVLHDGKLRLDRYALSAGAEGRWVSFSVAKSLTSTLAGAAIKEGYISSVDDVVTRYIPELRDSAYDGVTVRQLLTMTSGAKWNEDYTDLKADVAQFYASPVEPGLQVTVSYMRKLARDATPGQKWHYSTGETNLLGVLVARATKKNLATYASEKIWARYGMERDALWMLDRTDDEQGGCCVQATTRDYARFGQFILDGARINGHSIVADGWLDAATHKQVDIGEPGSGYGYQWWTRDDGTFSAYGLYGQQIYIDPARKLVVAINSAWSVPEFTNESRAARLALLDAIRAAIDSERRSNPGK